MCIGFLVAGLELLCKACASDIGFDGRSTAYHKITVTWAAYNGRRPASRSYVDLFIYLGLKRSRQVTGRIMQIVAVEIQSNGSRTLSEGMPFVVSIHHIYQQPQMGNVPEPGPENSFYST